MSAPRCAPIAIRGDHRARRKATPAPYPCWEIAIKSALGKPDFDVDIDELRVALPAVPFLDLPVRWDHAVALAALPKVHRDPFDRLLAAQARTEPLVLLTSDPVIARYPVTVRLVG